MKTFRYIFMTFVLAGSLTSCLEEETVWNPQDANLVTRTEMGLAVGDSISVLDGKAKPLYTVETVGAPSVFATQDGLSEGTTDIFAVFPYDLISTRADKSVSFVVPSVQKAVKDGLDKAAAKYVAYSSNLVAQTELNFIPMTSYLRLNFPEEEKIKRVTFRSITGEYIAGEAKVSLVDEENPYIIVTEGVDQIVLSADEPLSGEYTVCLLPTVLQNGLEITMHNAMSETVVKKMICRDENGVVSAMSLTRGKVNSYDITFDSVELEWRNTIVANIEKSLFNDVIISWTYEGEPSRFLILIDGKQVGAVDAPANTFNIKTLENGFSGFVSVVAQYPDGSELRSREVPLTTMDMEVKLDKVFWSDAWISWSSLSEPDSFRILIDGTVVAELPGTTNQYHITGLANGFSGKITVASVRANGIGYSEPIEFKTGTITQLTKNVSPSSISFNVENMTGMEPCEDGPALYLEIYDGPDPESANKLVGEYVVCRQSGYFGSPFAPSYLVDEKKSCPPLNMTFGPLQPDTEYWVRVKTVDTYTGDYCSKANVVAEEFTVNTAAGSSEFSAMLPIRTGALHQPSETEVIFQGFDEMTGIYDFMNCSATAFPEFFRGGLAKDKMLYETVLNWDGSWDFSPLLPISQVAHIGWYKQITSSTEVFTLKGSGAGATIDEGQPAVGAKVYNFKPNHGSLTGWYATNNTYACPGYINIAKTYDSANKAAELTGMVATPALPEGLLAVDSAKDCVLSFKGLCLYGRQCKLEIWVYDASAGSWAKKHELEIENSSGSIAKTSTWSALSDGHKWYEHTCDLSLKAGDVVAIAAPKGAATLIDDICINLK